jgi:hypothetical protein
MNLAADDATDRFAQMEVILCQWRRICALLANSAMQAGSGVGCRRDDAISC